MPIPFQHKGCEPKIGADQRCATCAAPKLKCAEAAVLRGTRRWTQNGGTEEPATVTKPNPYRPFRADPAQLALKPQVSGNDINSRGEATPHAPRVV